LAAAMESSRLLTACESVMGAGLIWTTVHIVRVRRLRRLVMSAE
jgi:hypothetical protein